MKIYTPQQLAAAIALSKEGMPSAQVARLTGVSSSSVRAYKTGRIKIVEWEAGPDTNKAAAQFLRKIADRLDPKLDWKTCTHVAGYFQFEGDDVCKTCSALKPDPIPSITA